MALEAGAVFYVGFAVLLDTPNNILFIPRLSVFTVNFLENQLFLQFLCYCFFNFIRFFLLSSTRNGGSLLTHATCSDWS